VTEKGHIGPQFYNGNVGQRCYVTKRWAESC
jgi:hypothetical protein